MTLQLPEAIYSKMDGNPAKSERTPTVSPIQIQIFFPNRILLKQLKYAGTDTLVLVQIYICSDFNGYCTHFLGSERISESESDLDSVSMRVPLAGEKRSSVLHTGCVGPEVHPIHQRKHQHLSHYIRVYVTVHGDKSLYFRQKRPHLRRDILMPLA